MRVWNPSPSHFASLRSSLQSRATPSVGSQGGVSSQAPRCQITTAPPSPQLSAAAGSLTASLRIRFDSTKTRIQRPGSPRLTAPEPIERHWTQFTAVGSCGCLRCHPWSPDGSRNQDRGAVSRLVWDATEWTDLTLRFRIPGLNGNCCTGLHLPGNRLVPFPRRDHTAAPVWEPKADVHQACILAASQTRPGFGYAVTCQSRTGSCGHPSPIGPLDSPRGRSRVLVSRDVSIKPSSLPFRRVGCLFPNRFDWSNGH